MKRHIVQFTVKTSELLILAKVGAVREVGEMGVKLPMVSKVSVVPNLVWLSSVRPFH